ncbi:MAG TPA: ATP-binding domain-containing protein, partial [Actinobacteria bacterium]|nr:ATP-binding domain-containing protein [Actinomycetota bacterium]
MTRMIPPYLKGRIENYGESLVFNLLRDAPETDDWVALHSYNLPNQVTCIGREIDFLVMVPQKGLFVLEVKSGNAIQRKDGEWEIRNSDGRAIYASEEGPFKQALRAMYSLHENLKKWFGLESRYNSFLITYGVVFPEIDFNYSDLEIEKWRVFDNNTKYSITEYINVLFENSLKTYKNESWYNPGKSHPLKKDISELLRQLRGSFEFNEVLSDKVNKIEKRINAFTNEQYDCLDALEENERCIFKGAAGTGKTMLALEAAKRSISEDKYTLIICFNRLLASWLQYQLKEYFPESENKYHVAPFLDYLESLTRKHGYFKLPDRTDSHYYSEDLPDYALKVLEKYPFSKFDRLIIDEGQDLINEEYLLVMDSLLKGGLKEGNWNIFCDLERQNIYNKKLNVREMLSLIKSYGDFTSYKLTVNCRNTIEIADEVYKLSGFNYKRCLSEHLTGIPVEYGFYENDMEQVILLEEVISSLHKNKIKPDDITILSPFRLQNSCVKSLRKKPNFEIINLSEDHERFLTRDTYTFSTIHKFKGMENLYIIITDINETKDSEYYKNLLYIGMSRAKVGLIILMN